MVHRAIRFSGTAAVILAVSILLITLSGLVPTTHAAASVTVDENFDNDPTAALSGSNWTVSAASGSVAVVEDPNNPSDKSVQITKTNTAGTVNADRKNLGQSGQIVIDYRVKSAELAGNKSAPYIYNDSTSITLVSVLLDNGSIKAYNGASNKTLQAFSINTWYRIQLILNTSTSKYDMYIDGRLAASQFAFRNTSTAATFLRFALGTNQTGTVSFDDLKVTQLPASISMEADYRLAVGHTHASSVTSSYEDATSGTVTKAAWYESSNPSVAQVDAAGIVTAQALGTATITAHYAGKTATTTLQVTGDVVLNSLQLDSAAYSLPQGSDHATVVTAVYSNGPRVVTASTAYVSGDPLIASVNSAGLVTGKSAGTTVISATYGGRTATAAVTVTPILTELHLDSYTYALQAGTVHQTIVSAVYSNQTVTDVSALATYASSDSSVAWVDQAGHVAGSRAGTTVITATYGGKSISSQVSVSSIRLDSEGYGLQPNATHQTSVLQLMADGSETNVTALASFSSSNPAAAEIDASGKVTGKAEGTTIISAVYGESRGVAHVSVRPFGISSSITVPIAGKDTIQVHLWAQGVENVYAAQSDIDFDPAVLRFQHAVSGLFTGTFEALDSHNSVYRTDGSLIGFQSIRVQAGHLSWGATQAGAGTGGNKPYVTLSFKVLNPGQETNIQVSNAVVTTRAGGSLNRASLSGVSATLDAKELPPIVVPPPIVVDPPIVVPPPIVVVPPTVPNPVIPDTIAPSDPVVSVTGKSRTSVSLSWTAATDNIGVTGYEVYNGTEKIAALTANLEYYVSGLRPSTNYTFAVKAKDAAGNASTGSIVFVQTSNGNQSGSNSGNGSAAGVSGPDSDMDKAIDKNEARQKVAASDLRTSKDGQLTIRMDSGKNELLLPAEVLSLLGSNKLEIQHGDIVVSLPAEVIQSLVGLIGNDAAKDAQISFKLSIVEGKDKAALLASALDNKEASVRGAGAVLQLDLSIMTKDGTEKKLDVFSKPVEVAIPYISGSDLQEQLLGVYYLNEQTRQWAYTGGQIDTATKQIKVVLAHFSTYTVFEYNKSYSDVPSSHWASNAVQILSAKHIVNGVDEVSFAPEALTTRAEFTTLLVRTLGLTAKGRSPFQDVSTTDWYADAVAAAYEAKLVGGRTDISFAPQDKLSREEMAVMLVRAYEAVKNPIPSSSAASSYTDLANVSEWALDSVEAAASIGLMSGRGGGQFLPGQLTNRAETAQAIFNMLQKTIHNSVMNLQK